MNKFGGFTQDQMEVLARNMGYDGPMSKFDEFLAASPDQAAKLGLYTQKAIEMVEGAPQSMATGGKVEPAKNKPSAYVKKNLGKNRTNASATDVNKVATFRPEKLVSETDTSNIKYKTNQKIGDKGNVQGKAHTTNPAIISEAAQAELPEDGTASTYDATQVQDGVEGIVEGTKTSQGTLSENAQMKAATALPSANATVQGQLESLYSQFDDGNIPPWAAGAKRKVDTIMNQRGMGASSMAAAATTQALMESSLEIAMQDAATFSAFEMQNLNNRQQARLHNAQGFLQMDLENLEIEHATEMFKSQSMIQSMFTDQAADNAAKQFNATSENQTEQFFADLGARVRQFNAELNQQTKLANQDSRNASRQFNAQMKNMRDQFNASQRLIIDQSNAEWRRKIATVNNAEQNENNRVNAQLLTGMTTQAMNNWWQSERDLMAFAFTASQNIEQRNHELALAKIDKDLARELRDDGRSNVMGQALGRFAGTLVDGAAESLVSAIF